MLRARGPIVQTLVGLILAALLSGCRRRHAGGQLEDWLVRAGSGVSAPVQTLRYIRWRRGGTRYEGLTNVLDAARLAAEEALALYPYRWRIERMYFDLKEVLNLNRVYAANPNPVAMQVYAAGLVYNTMRVAQGEVAEAAGITPEEISPAKFYPKLAAACHSYVVTQLTVLDIRRLNPRRRLRLRLRDWRTTRWASVSLEAIRVERRRVVGVHAGSAPLGATGSPSLTSVVVASSSGYLSGDDSYT